MLNKLRSLASDTAVYGVSTIVQRFLTFLLTPIYSNYLLSADIGDVANLYSLIAFVNVVYSFGFESAFFRFYKRDSNDKNKVYTTAFILIMGISSFFTLLFAVAAPWFANLAGVHSGEGAQFIRYAAAIALFDAVMIIPFARLRMERKARHFAILKAVMVVINVVANLVLVIGFTAGAQGVFWSGIVSSLLGAIVFVPSIISHIQPPFNKRLFKEMLAFGLPTLPSNFSAMLLQVADRPILQKLTNAETVAMYQTNYRLAIPMMLAVSVFEFAWKPFYLSHSEDKDAKDLFSRVLTYFTLVCAVLFLLLAFFMEFVVRVPFIGGRFINPLYWSGLGIIPIVAAGYFFNGLATNLAAGLHITKQTKYLPYATGMAAAVNVLINLMLIPMYSYVGAAWATLIAYMASAAVMYYYAQQAYPIKYEWNRIGIVVGVTSLMYFLSTLLLVPDSLAATAGLRLLLLLCFAFCIYMLRFFTAEEIRTVQRILKR